VTDLAPRDAGGCCPLPNHAAGCYYSSCHATSPTSAAPTYSMSLYPRRPARPGTTPLDTRAGSTVVPRGSAVGGWAEYTVVPRRPAINRGPNDASTGRRLRHRLPGHTGVSRCSTTAGRRWSATVLVTGWRRAASGVAGPSKAPALAAGVDASSWVGATRWPSDREGARASARNTPCRPRGDPTVRELLPAT